MRNSIESFVTTGPNAIVDSTRIGNTNPIPTIVIDVVLTAIDMNAAIFKVINALTSLGTNTTRKDPPHVHLSLMKHRLKIIKARASHGMINCTTSNPRHEVAKAAGTMTHHHLTATENVLLVSMMATRVILPPIVTNVRDGILIRNNHPVQRFLSQLRTKTAKSVLSLHTVPLLVMLQTTARTSSRNFTYNHYPLGHLLFDLFLSFIIYLSIYILSTRNNLFLARSIIKNRVHFISLCLLHLNKS